MVVYAPAVPFSVTQKTLERLEWSRILDRLAEHARTPAARLRTARDETGALPMALFGSTAEAVQELLAETSEARAILVAGDHPPLAGVGDLEAPLRRVRKSGALAPRELLEVGAALATLRSTQRFLSVRREQAPRLADLADTFSDQQGLERAIEASLDPAGGVRDDASPALGRARREVHQIAGEIQSRLDRTLRNPDIASALSDRYFTVRNDRYVLPVRADARRQIRGIVHDASGSGTTLYVEPEALVELNNRHKQAEIEIEREVLRILRALSTRVAAIAEMLESELERLAGIDLAFARAHLAQDMDAAEPVVGDEGRVALLKLRHPALPRDEAVPNDVRLGETFDVLVVSGPNAGGKTVAMKSVALAALLCRAGMHVPAAAPARIDLFDAVLADIGDEQDIASSLSTFSAHMANLARIVDSASPRSLIVLDEIGVGTDPGEGAAIAQAVLEALADAGAKVITTTHYNLLKEMADVDPRFANASVEFDPDTLAPTYRLRMGVPGTSSATAVAARMGLRSDVLERAHGFLEREDRQLDRMLSELATSRAALESEQREAARLRQETEAERDEYRHKLERLQERRDKLYRAMRDDLDKSFRDAHGQIAAVIRELQQGGTAQAAAQAREHLKRLENQARRAEREAGVESAASEALEPIDWQSARPGDTVRVTGGGTAILVALPDSRGRVAVRLGSARVTVAAERVGRAQGEGAPKPARRTAAVSVSPSDEPPSGEAGRCDLRGLRVDEALDRLLAALDRAISAERGRLVVIHGVGTGALRAAVREHLKRSKYVTGIEAAAPNEGGAGVTVAILD